MNEKKADNVVLETKQKINQVNDRIDIQKNKIKKLDSMQEDFISLNKSLNKCIELLSTSIKSNKTKYMFEDMYNNNNALLAKASNALDEEKSNTRRVLNDLYSQKSQIEKKSKQKEE